MSASPSEFAEEAVPTCPHRGLKEPGAPFPTSSAASSGSPLSIHPHPCLPPLEGMLTLPSTGTLGLYGFYIFF